MTTFASDSLLAALLGFVAEPALYAKREGAHRRYVAGPPSFLTPLSLCRSLRARGSSLRRCPPPSLRRFVASSPPSSLRRFFSPLRRSSIPLSHASRWRLVTSSLRRRFSPSSLRRFVAPARRGARA